MNAVISHNAMSSLPWGTRLRVMACELRTQRSRRRPDLRQSPHLATNRHVLGTSGNSRGSILRAGDGKTARMGMIPSKGRDTASRIQTNHARSATSGAVVKCDADRHINIETCHCCRSLNVTHAKQSYG